MTKSSAKSGRGGGRKKAEPEATEAPRSRGALDLYRQKRDPALTNEPFSAERIVSDGRSTTSAAFVVHQHDARRRHWDLRLQVGATLKSFAVPRGPTLDPREKRLAVHTEDHPIEYADFEEVIPEGAYGAGSMIAWDLGRVRFLEPAEEGFMKGKLDFVLSGFKLRGRFALVRIGDRKGKEPDEKNQWLLLKKVDAFSREGGPEIVDEMPESVLSGLTTAELIEKKKVADALEKEAAERGAKEGRVDARRTVPMLANPGGKTLTDESRLYEIKIDGVRLLAEKADNDVTLVYRSQRVMTTSYPEVVRAVRALAPSRLVLDGEVVAFDASGHPSFQLLGRRMHVTRPNDVAAAAAEVPVTYVVFDLLELGPYDLRKLPLRDRKELLAKVVPERGIVRYLDHLEGDGRPLEALVKSLGLEGIVGKRASAPYREGPDRTDDWVKIKHQQEADFAVVGWTEGNTGRKSFGALEVASYVDGKYVLRSRVGSGFDHGMIQKVLALLGPLEVSAPTAVGEPMPGGGKRHFVTPRIVANVSFTEWTEDQGLRHPVFHGLREDVDPTSCTAAPRPRQSVEELLERPPPEPPPPKPATAKAGPSRVKVSNRNKIFWPDEGYTKGDLVDYYARIAETALPFLRERPIVLVRYPDGIVGKNFYQWNVPEGTPSWIRTLHLPDDEGGSGKHTFLVDDADGLVHVANLGCIPIHVLPYRATSMEESDYFVVDFDVGPRTFADAVTLAFTLREVLSEIGLVGFPKTSGQSGLHVLVPLGPGVSFDASKMLVDLVGRVVQARHPDLSTMERRIAERGDRVFIDVGQTGRARTIVAPYSVRAQPGAPVSTPLRWEELHRALDPRELTMFTVPDRVAERGDPLVGFFDVRPDVPRVVGELGKRLGIPI
ncbi:MAG TPA: DNA ligase D [Polyangiaceae bacterium]|nr:DNA ligase D [Polyangiaceae bacterium]